MELTQQHFDQVVKTLSTKDDLKNAISTSEQKIIARIDEAQEELARITNTGFDDVLERLDVKERMQKLEKQMTELRTALHLSA